MKTQVRKIYDAYRNVFALMANRGYTPEEDHEMQDFEQFKVTVKTWENDSQQFWIVFERDADFVAEACSAVTSTRTRDPAVATEGDTVTSFMLPRTCMTTGTLMPLVWLMDTVALPTGG